MSRLKEATTLPQMKYNQCFAKLPAAPGQYFWTEWDAEVEVYKKPRRESLFVTPPNGLEIRVTARLAGDFYRLANEHCPTCGHLLHE